MRVSTRKMRIQKKNYKAIDVKKYSNDESVRWNNFVAPKTQYLEFTLGDGETTFRVYVRSKLPTITDKSVGLLVEIDGQPAALWLSTWPLIERIRGYITESKLKNLPQELRAELLEAALDPLLSSITTKLNIPIKVLNFLKIMPHDVNDYSVAFKITENNSRDLDAVLVMNKNLQPVIEGLLNRWPSYFYPSWKNHVTPLWVEAGATDLSVSELKGLELGDVLILDASVNIKNQQLCVRLASGARFRGSIENKSIILKSGVIDMSNEGRDDGIDIHQ